MVLSVAAARAQIVAQIVDGSDKSLTPSKVRQCIVDAVDALSLASPTTIYHPRGGWNAASGVFPGSGSAALGDVYVVTNSGTVDGVSFGASDQIVALADNASTTTYAGNWLQIESGETWVAEAAQSASDAATSETNAATSATAAATSATNAANSATAAEGYATAAASYSESMAWGYTFDSGTTEADPGTAKFRFNHASFASATYLYISEAADEGDLSALMSVWDDSTSVIKATLQVRDPLIPTHWLEMYISGAITDVGSYRKIPITPIAAGGTLADGTTVKLGVIRNGDTGSGAVDSFNTRTGPVSPASGDYTASQITNVPAGNIAATTVQAAINELDGEKQPIDATLTALAGVTTAADKLIYATAADTFATTDFTAAGRALIDDADAAAQRTTLGLVIGTDVEAAVPGRVIWVAMSSAPTGYLKCNGAAVSRTTYATLFTAIGTTFGAGDGSTTFALPDLRGEFVRGLDDGRGVDASRALGSAQADAFASHQHYQTHTGTGSATDQIGYGGGSLGTQQSVLSTSSTGGSETRPRNVALLACIKY